MAEEFNQGNPPATGVSGGFSNPLSSVRQQIENQMGQAIDHYASHVPGGDKFTPEAKQALSGVLDGLQRQLETEAANRLGSVGGGMFGGNQSNQSNPNNQGSLL